MCIDVNDSVKVKKGVLQLWKVIRVDNRIGIWGETYDNRTKFFIVGENTAVKFYDTCNYADCVGQFHCFLTRDEARSYYKRRNDMSEQWETKRGIELKDIKIIKVFVHFDDVVKIGYDRDVPIRAISVSKMTIKSLKHQR